MAFNAGSWALRIETLGPTTAVANIADFNLQVTEDNVTAAFWALVKSDGGDIRASTDTAGANELAIHVQHIDVGLETLNLRINFPLYDNATRTLFLSVGNPSADLYAETDPFGARAAYPKHQFMYHFDEPEFSVTAKNHAAALDGTYIAPWKNAGVPRDTVLGTAYNPSANGNVPAGILKPNIPIGTYDATGGKEFYVKLVIDLDTADSLGTIFRCDNGGAPFLTLFKIGANFSYRFVNTTGTAASGFSGVVTKKAVYLHRADNATMRFFSEGVVKQTTGMPGDLASNALAVMALGGNDGTGDWPNFDNTLYEASFIVDGTRSAEFNTGGFFALDTSNTETPETFWTFQAEVASGSYALNLTIAEIPDGTYPTTVVDAAAGTIIFDGDLAWADNAAVLAFGAFDTLPIDVEYFVHNNYHGGVGIGTATPV